MAGASILGWKGNNADNSNGWLADEKWNPSTPFGINTWKNWAANSTPEQQASYAGRVGQDWGALNSTIQGLGNITNLTTGTANTPNTPNTTGNNDNKFDYVSKKDPAPSDPGYATWLAEQNRIRDKEIARQKAITDKAIADALDREREKNNGNNTGGNTSGIQLFQPDLYPESGSRGNSSGGGSSNNESTSTSGLDWDNPFVKNMLGKIVDSTDNMSGNIDDWTQASADNAEAAARLQARKIMPGMLNSLSQRGILNSTVGEGSIQGLLGQIAEEAAMKNYSASQDAAKMKQSIPSILGQLAELGKGSQSSGFGSSINNTQSSNNSWSSDPSVPYRSLMDLYASMM